MQASMKKHLPSMLQSKEKKGKKKRREEAAPGSANSNGSWATSRSTERRLIDDLNPIPALYFFFPILLILFSFFLFPFFRTNRASWEAGLPKEPRVVESASHIGSIQLSSTTVGAAVDTLCAPECQKSPPAKCCLNAHGQITIDNELLRNAHYVLLSFSLPQDGNKLNYPPPKPQSPLLFLWLTLAVANARHVSIDNHANFVYFTEIERLVTPIRKHHGLSSSVVKAHLNARPAVQSGLANMQIARCKMRVRDARFSGNAYETY
jgi:hypothetical protein